MYQQPKYISVMTTLEGIGMVTVHDKVNVFGLGGIDMLHCCCCGRASTEACYCQIHPQLAAVSM